MARDLYMPSNISNYTKEEINEIYKRFFKGFKTYRDKPELKQLLEEIDQYMKELKALNVRDDEVKQININFFRIIINFIYIIPFVVVNLAFVILFLFYEIQSIPGLVILTPLGMYNRYLAEKARKEALAGSNVKVVGADVMATKKLITSMMMYPPLCSLFCYILYSYLGYW